MPWETPETGEPQYVCELCGKHPAVGRELIAKCEHFLVVAAIEESRRHFVDFGIPGDFMGSNLTRDHVSRICARLFDSFGSDCGVGDMLKEARVADVFLDGEFLARRFRTNFTTLGLLTRKLYQIYFDVKNSNRRFKGVKAVFQR